MDPTPSLAPEEHVLFKNTTKLKGEPQVGFFFVTTLRVLWFRVGENQPHISLPFAAIKSKLTGKELKSDGGCSITYDFGLNWSGI